MKPIVKILIYLPFYNINFSDRGARGNFVKSSGISSTHTHTLPLEFQIHFSRECNLPDFPHFFTCFRNLYLQCKIVHAFMYSSMYGRRLTHFCYSLVNLYLIPPPPPPPWKYIVFKFAKLYIHLGTRSIRE